MMEWFGLTANLATALGFFLLAWQLWLGRIALKAQTRAIGIQAYTTLNGEFLAIMSSFTESINSPNTTLSDFSEHERRALDRFFYLANMEFVLIKEGIVDAGIAEQWKRGIKAASKKPVFAERWRTCASGYTLDNSFRQFFEDALAPPGQ